jgi:Isochorismatase family
MATALLLVDVQRNMLEGNTPVPGAAQVRPVLQSLLARARTADALVVHIQNDGPAGSPDEPQTQGWELVFAPVRGELAIRKAGPDIFTADACLATTLTARGIDRVVVAGMQSNHQCQPPVTWSSRLRPRGCSSATWPPSPYDDETSRRCASHWETTRTRPEQRAGSRGW